MEDRSPQTVQADAQAVLSHLQAGGNWGNFLRKPAAVRERSYLKQVLVNGQSADTIEVLQALLDGLSLAQQVSELEANWAAVGVTLSGPLALRLAQLTEENQALGRVLALGDTLDTARAAVRAIPGLPEPQWWIDTEVSALQDAVQAAATAQAAEVQRQMLEERRPSLQGLLSGGSAHPVTQQLLDAIEQRHIDGYGLALRHARALHQRLGELQQMNALLSRLRQTAPSLAQELEDQPSDPAWDSRLAHLGAAWNWLRANAYLEELANPDAETEKRSRLEACRQGVRDTLKELATSKAWSSTLDRLTYAEQQALVRWEHAIKKLGKGTGKHAERWRKAARSALEDARSAIPPGSCRCTRWPRPSA